MSDICIYGLIGLVGTIEILANLPAWMNTDFHASKSSN